MLKGSKIDDCKWVIRNIGAQRFLSFEKDHTMYLKFQADRLENQLIKVVESVDSVRYYMFSFNSDMRFLFITSENVNFASIDRYENRMDSTFGLIIRGALYDISANRFVRFDGTKKGEVFYNFVIYDCGIPHIVYDEEEENFVVGYINNKSRWTFEKTEHHEAPVLVSHIHFNESQCECKLTRVIFYKSDDGENKMLVLKNELEQVMYENAIQYENIFYNCSEANSEKHYYHLVHGNLNVPYDFSNPIEELGILHITEDDCIIVRDSDTEDFSVLYLNMTAEHDATNDFFEYSIVDPSEVDYETNPMRLKVTYRKNDFENATAVIDCIMRQVI